MAQQNPPPAAGSTNVVDEYGPKRQIATIVYMGLGGAVLGLSTLSFYGRPQDKLTNIWIGFGAGVIVGTIWMTYQAATNPQEFYRADFTEDRPLVADLYAQQIQSQSAPVGLTMTWKF